MNWTPTKVSNSQKSFRKRIIGGVWQNSSVRPLPATNRPIFELHNLELFKGSFTVQLMHSSSQHLKTLSCAAAFKCMKVFAIRGSEAEPLYEGHGPAIHKRRATEK